MIIVTGGAGFIGSALIWKLNKLGNEDIIVVDHFGEDKKYKNLVYLKFRDVFDKTDFANMIENGFLKKNKIDIIYHLGACSATTEKNMGYLLKNNYEYSKLLCKNACENGIRFIYASSAATYGNGSCGYKDDENTIENLIPMNAYGFSKHLFDLWIKREGYLQEVVGLKYFNVFGPNEYHKGEMRSVALKAFEQIKNTGKVKLFKSYLEEFADGEQKRDFIYVKDAVDMTLHFGNNPKLCGIYNIGTGSPNTFNHLVNKIFQVLQQSVNIEYIDMPEDIRKNYQYYTCADMTKFYSTGFNQKLFGFDKGIEDYILYLKSDNWYLN
ncbi:MAG: ADP-glyceromanno-heptose 6-epimerase [Ignavibacteria bacterium]|nr:ADP-glyceromanno-heptose 6-epimerase [Ignavibacteria bacterium]